MECSRESWNVVKKKTADSEREWHALRAEFAARRKMFKSAYARPGGCTTEGSESSEAASSESGFSEDNTPDSEQEKECEEKSSDPMTESTITIKNEEAEVEDPEEPLEVIEAVETTETTEDLSQKSISVLIPSMEFMAEVPPDLFPPLLPPEDENYSDLYQRLMASTARSAALANRLAEMHRTNSDSEEEEDYEPKTEDDSIIQGATSPDIISEIASEDVEANLHEAESQEVEDDDDPSSEELEDLGLSQEAIEEALAKVKFSLEFT